MTDVLCVAEHRDGKLRKVSFELLTAARRIVDGAGEGSVTAVVLSDSGSEMAQQLADRGADAVLVGDDGALKQYTADAYTDALAALVEERGFDCVLIGASYTGQDFAPRLAARLEAGLAADVVGVEVQDGTLVFRKPIVTGKAFVQVKVTTAPVIASMRPNAVPAAQAGEGGGGATVETFEPQVGEVRTEVLSIEATGGDRPELTEAEIVVSGGRGIGGPEHYHVIEELADALGAACGASRAVVDAGWKAHSFQVGQTGKIVSPKLYIACGISGAIQHQVGMKGSKYVVAVNTDPEAPIFDLADFGVVGDLFDVCPLLTEAIKEARAEG